MTVTLQPAPAKILPCEPNPELFFPIGTKSASDLAQIEMAKAICRRCPVLNRCGQFIDTWKAQDRHVGMVAAAKYFPPGPSQRDRSTTAHVPAPRPESHGSVAGYRAHKNRGEEECDACRDAYNTYRRACRANSRQGAAA